MEKTRITSPAETERSYHVFYQLISSLSPEKKVNYIILSFFPNLLNFLKLNLELYGITSPSAFNYLKKSGCYTINGVDDCEHFERLQIALSFLQISPQEQETIWKLLIAILYIGNLEVVEKKDAAVINNPESKEK